MVALLLLALALAQDGGAQIEDADQPEVVSQPDAGTPVDLARFRSTEGYQAARWGMTKRELLKLFPKGRANKDGDEISFEGITAGRVSRTTFGLLKDHLVLVVVEFTQKFLSPNRFIEEHESIKTALGKKYGAPLRDDKFWREEMFKDDPDRWGMAVALEHLTLSTSWSTSETEILLHLGALGHTPELGVTYKSRTLWPLVDQDLARRQADDL